MSEIQLELKLVDETPEQAQINAIQRQVDSVDGSLGKVRRKIFSEMAEIRRQIADLHAENQSLKQMLRQSTVEKAQWSYSQGGNLFDMSECEQAMG